MFKHTITKDLFSESLEKYIFLGKYLLFREKLDWLELNYRIIKEFH